MATSLKLFAYGSDLMKNWQVYQSIVRALQYVTITKPKISYCVNRVC